MAKYSERKNTRSSSGSAGGPTTKKAKDTKEETSSEIIKRHQDEAIENLRKGRKTESEVDGGCDDRRFDILFTAVRVLIDTNNEIYERCKQYCKKITTDGEIRFYRIGYFTVKVWKDDDEKKEMNVGSTLEVELEDFKNFTCLPSELNDLGFKAADDVDSILDGYEKYFRTITFFTKPLAFQYLMIFKKHLQDVQAALGNIETWITEPYRNLDFINEQFGTNLDLPGLQDISDGAVLDPPSGKEDSICLYCFDRRCYHVRKKVGGGWEGSSNPSQHINYCPGDLNFGRFTYYGEFFCTGVPKNLKTLPATGTINMEFNISQATDQDRLKSFMAAFAQS